MEENHPYRPRPKIVERTPKWVARVLKGLVGALLFIMGAYAGYVHGYLTAPKEVPQDCPDCVCEEKECEYEGMEEDVIGCKKMCGVHGVKSFTEDGTNFDCRCQED